MKKKFKPTRSEYPFQSIPLGRYVSSANQISVAHIDPAAVLSKKQQTELTHLFAAAPDYYKAVESLFDEIDAADLPSDIMSAVYKVAPLLRHAHRKAKGKT